MRYHKDKRERMFTKDIRVVQVVQAGYQIGDRVLRPAMVGVAKGGPKQTVEAEPGAPNPEAEKDA